MEELTLIENLEKYPYLKDHINTTLIVSNSKFHLFEIDQKVSKGKKKISLELLRYLILKDEYYAYIKKLMIALEKIVEAMISKYYNNIDMGIYLCFLESCLDYKNYKYERKLYSEELEDNNYIKIAEYYLK